MGYPKNEEQELLFEYDFAKDGGAVGNISLRPLVNGLKEGCIVRGLEVRTKTALASGGSPTLTLGNTSDADGYMADFYSLASSADSVVNSSAVAGALVWDDTNDHPIHYRIGSAANVQDLVIAVGTAALTAGKLEVLVKFSSDGN
jgi:hypothetical protein